MAFLTPTQCVGQESNIKTKGLPQNADSGPCQASYQNLVGIELKGMDL